MENVSRHMSQDAQALMGLKDDAVGKVSETALEQDHRVQRLQERARLSFEKLPSFHDVSDRCLRCVDICVVFVVPWWLLWRVLSKSSRTGSKATRDCLSIVLFQIDVGSSALDLC